jgi:hypothetical protein
MAFRVLFPFYNFSLGRRTVHMEADVLDERDYSCKIAIDFALFIFHQVHIIAKVFEMVH